LPSKYTGGNGEVETGALFLDIGGRQVNRDAAVGEPVPGILDGRPDAVLALLDRGVRQSNCCKLGKPSAISTSTWTGYESTPIIALETAFEIKSVCLKS
jgi:hypothetical protein